MKRILKFGILSISLLFVSGCDNANRSMVFFTGTTLGIEIAFEPNSAAPAKFIIGYKRAEGLMDPVMEDAATAGDYTIKDTSHSVLAKIAGEVRSGTGPNNPGLVGAQWFAAGEAANILARHPATAVMMTNDPAVAREAVKAQQFGASMKGLNAQFAKMVLNQIEFALSQLVSTNSEAQRHIDELASIAQAQLPVGQYSAFSWNASNSTIQESAQSVPARNLAALISYGSSVGTYAKELKSALAVIEAGINVELLDNAGVRLATVTSGDAVHQRLKVTHDNYVAVEKRVNEIVQSDPAVVAAVQFYIDQLIK